MTEAILFLIMAIAGIYCISIFFKTNSHKETYTSYKGLGSGGYSTGDNPLNMTYSANTDSGGGFTDFSACSDNSGGDSCS